MLETEIVYEIWLMRDGNMESNLIVRVADQNDLENTLKTFCLDIIPKSLQNGTEFSLVAVGYKELPEHICWTLSEFENKSPNQIVLELRDTILLHYDKQKGKEQ